MKKKLYRIKKKGKAAAPCPQHHKPWQGRPPRKDDPEPVHSRYHRRIAPSTTEKRRRDEKIPPSSGIWPAL